jgi:acyl carrier protein
MKLDDKISKIVFEAAQSVADADLPMDAPPCSFATVLLGDGACFDSMGFVNFVVAVEDSLESKLQVRVNLSEELSSEFPDAESTLTAGDLTNFLSALLQKRGLSAG